MPPPLPPQPFRLLELTVISAQDLSPTARPLYAAVWIDPSRRLFTLPDPSAAWNDKFAFRVDDRFLLSDTAAVTVQIRAASRLRFLPDPVVGVSRVVVSSLHASPSTKFIALQVRRPTSLRPQGILNLGVRLIDAPALPLFLDLGSPSALAYRDLISLPRRRRDGDDASGRHHQPIDDDSTHVSARSSSVAEREREVLQLKLERWRIDLSPARTDATLAEEATAAHRRRMRRRALSCFCGRAEAERMALEMGGGMEPLSPPPGASADVAVALPSTPG